MAPTLPAPIIDIFFRTRYKVSGIRVGAKGASFGFRISRIARIVPMSENVSTPVNRYQYQPATTLPRYEYASMDGIFRLRLR